MRISSVPNVFFHLLFRCPDFPPFASLGFFILDCFRAPKASRQGPRFHDPPSMSSPEKAVFFFCHFDAPFMLHFTLSPPAAWPPPCPCWCVSDHLKHDVYKACWITLCDFVYDVRSCIIAPPFAALPVRNPTGRVDSHFFYLLKLTLDTVLGFSPLRAFFFFPPNFVIFSFLFFFFLSPQVGTQLPIRHPVELF